MPKYDIWATGEGEDYLLGECVNAGLGWFVEVDNHNYHTYTLKEAEKLAEHACKVA